jgi:hypothetical protein
VNRTRDGGATYMMQVPYSDIRCIRYLAPTNDARYGRFSVRVVIPAEKKKLLGPGGALLPDDETWAISLHSEAVTAMIDRDSLDPDCLFHLARKLGVQVELDPIPAHLLPWNHLRGKR